MKAISFHDGQAHIEQSECLYCGSCYETCPSHAKVIRDDKPRLDELLKEGECYASIAPSFRAAFPRVSFASLQSALRQLGFQDAEETSRGARFVSKAYEEILPNYDVLLSSSCPSVNLLLERHYADLLPCLAPVFTPLEAHCLDIKKRHPKAKTVFFGPCIAKKEEADRQNNSLDLALTFLDLEALLQENHLVLQEEQEHQGPLERLYPEEGGILATMKKEEPGYRYLALSGVETIIEALEEIRAGKLHHVFLELSACRGSCLNGPAMPNRKVGAVESKILLEEFGGQGHFDSKEYRAKDIRKDFNGFHGHKHSFSEDQIQEVLERMGKHNKQDELNCACCGYSSCREKAIAVLEGKAQVEMCLPYLMEKAKSVSAHIYENSPNGILTASKEWKIELANQAAEKLFGISKETMLGKDLSELIPMELIADAVEKGRAENKKLNLESGKVVEATVLFSEKYGTLMAILHDRTEREAEHQANLKRRKEATSLANEVIEKNMAAVQQIAQLLGESAAETKIALTRLEASLSPKEDHGK